MNMIVGDASAVGPIVDAASCSPAAVACIILHLVGGLGGDKIPAVDAGRFIPRAAARCALTEVLCASRVLFSFSLPSSSWELRLVVCIIVSFDPRSCRFCSEGKATFIM